MVQDAELGKRFVDKLAKVALRDGSERWVYVHLEVQGSAQAEFAERMFVYHYRLFDRYRQPVASLALLADTTASWRPSQFGYQALGCSIELNFPTAKLLDYAAQQDQLYQQPQSLRPGDSGPLTDPSHPARHERPFRRQVEIGAVVVSAWLG